MAFRNTLDSFGTIAKFFHWIIATLILGLLTLGFAVTFLENHPIQEPLINIHKLFGLSVLVLVALRLLWRLFNPRPLYPPLTRPWEKLSAQIVHGLLYFIMIAMPISGWIMSTAAGHIPSFLGFEFPFPGITKDKEISSLFFNIHFYLAWFTIGLLVIHVLAALKHHYIDKDFVLTRMFPNAWNKPL